LTVFAPLILLPLMSNTSNATCGTGTAYLSGAPEFTPSF